MSKIRFTEEQESALILRKENLLVSAGAGSGKTAVLTEKIYRMILSGVSLDEMLVLTFTNKAAYEMKDRVKSKLSADPNYSHLADKVESSNITTFDAYSLSIVKKYGYLLGLDEDVDIIDDCIFRVQIESILNKIFKKYYENNNDDFDKLMFSYTVKTDRPIRDFVREILHAVQLELDPDKYFETYRRKFSAKKILDNSVKELMHNFSDILDSAESIYTYFSDSHVGEMIKENFVNPIRNNDYNSLYLKMIDFKFPPKNKKELKLEEDEQEFYTSLKDLLKNNILDIVRKIGSYDEMLKSAKECQKFNFLLLDITKEVYYELLAFKKKFNVYGFSDISAIAYKLINIPSVHKEIKSQIKFIMIDEYQDTSNLQEAFIESLSNNNVFMVGDVKQSIYRFRNANPTIFTQKYENYKNGNGGSLVTFSKNFRSRSAVLESINDLFEDVMHKNSGGVDYINNHQLIFGNKTCYDELGNVEYDSSLSLYSFEKVPEEHNQITETRFIVEDIKRKILSKYQVFDFTKKELRDCSFKDFAILVQSKTHYEEIEKIFNDNQIPLKSDALISSVSNKTMMLIKSILSLVWRVKEGQEENKLRHDFASIARSFVFRFSDEKIYNIIKNDKIKETEIYYSAADMAKVLNDMTLKEFALFLISKFQIVENLIYIGDIDLNQQIINKFVELSGEMDKIDYSYDQFIDFFSLNDQLELDIEIESNCEVEDAVNIMTMHKSKGLEFPILYIIGLANKSPSDTHAIRDSIVSSKYGIQISDITSERNNMFLTLSKIEESKEKVNEMMRLFYVALTRAKEKTIIYLPTKSFAKPNAPFNAKCMADFLASYKNFNKMIKPIFLDTPLVLPEKESKSKIYPFEFDKVHIESSIIEPKRASKQISLDADKKLLEFGTKMHFYMQVVDFETKDTSFIKSQREKKIIDNALKLPVFDNVTKAQILREYEFEDDENNSSGSIDLLLVYDDRVDIIDYKLKHITDDDYKYQLGVYEDFVATRTDKPIRKFLISLIDGKMEEIK